MSADPLCPEDPAHGRTARRVTTPALASWAGSWHDCATCGTSTLLAATELVGQRVDAGVPGLHSTARRLERTRPHTPRRHP